MSRGIQAAPRRWKSQGKGFSPTSSRKEGSLPDTLTCSPLRAVPDFSPTELQTLTPYSLSRQACRHMLQQQMKTNTLVVRWF